MGEEGGDQGINAESSLPVVSPQRARRGARNTAPPLFPLQLESRVD